MTAELFSALWVSLKVATVSTLAGLVPATLVGFLLATKEFRGKEAISALTSLPLVVPPTAVGYLLLRLFAVDGPLGVQTLGVELNVLLTWRAAVVATAVMSFPLIVRTTRVAFEANDPRLAQVAQTLGHHPVQAFLRFTLPLARRGIIAAAILGFTRALGEFGATVSIAGNIPGETATIASSIWSAQQVGAHDEAMSLIVISIVLGFAASLAAEQMVRRSARSRRGPALLLVESMGESR